MTVRVFFTVEVMLWVAGRTSEVEEEERNLGLVSVVCAAARRPELKRTWSVGVVKLQTHFTHAYKLVLNCLHKLGREPCSFSLPSRLSTFPRNRQLYEIGQFLSQLQVSQPKEYHGSCNVLVLGFSIVDRKLFERLYSLSLDRGFDLIASHDKASRELCRSHVQACRQGRTVSLIYKNEVRAPDEPFVYE